MKNLEKLRGSILPGEYKLDRMWGKKLKITEIG